mgnify:FL=1
MARKTPGIYIAIRGDYSAFETDLNRAKLVAKEQGEAIAKSIGNAVSKADLTGGINNLTRELKTAQTALSSGAFKAQVSGLDEIAKAAGVSSKQLEGLTNSMLKSQAAATANRAFEYLQKNAGLSTLQLARLRAELGDTSGAMSTLWNGAKAAAVPVMAIGAAAIYAGKACFDASLQMDRLVKSYTTIEGSPSGAVSQLDYIYEISSRLGLEFQSTAEAAKGFFAAGKGTTLQKELNGIFEGVSQAGAALSLSTEQMDGVFLALGQMISKGKVQAEELRGQLGERLPGAFNLAAKAMGVTTSQLDDMLKKGLVTAEDMLPKLAAVLKEEFGPAAEQAAQGAQGAVNRLSTEWNLFKATVMDNQNIIDAINAVTDALKRRNQAQKFRSDRDATIKAMEEAGVAKKTQISVQYDFYGNKQEIAFQAYTEEQIKSWEAQEHAWEAHNKYVNQLQDEETKILADGSSAVTNYLRNTIEGKKAALDEEYKNTVDALNKKIAVYKKQGNEKGVKELEQDFLRIDAEYNRQLEALSKKSMKSAESTARKQSSAARYIENIRAEISKLNGEMVQSWQQKLDIKLDDIAKKGKGAGLSLSELTAITEEYEAAADAKRVRDLADAFADLDLKIAQAAGDTRKVKDLGISKQVEEERRKLESLAKTPEEKASISEKLTVYKASLETEVKVENLQVAADFYEKLAALSGNYTQSAEYQNQVLEAQAEIYRRSLGPEHQQFVDEWEKLSRLQSGRDGWDGARRSALAFYAEATDFGKGFEQTTTNMLDNISGAFRITTDGLVVDWNNAMTTMANDFLQIFMRNIVGSIANSGMGWLGDFFGFGGAAASAGGVAVGGISGGWMDNFVSNGPSLFAGVGHSGMNVGSDFGDGLRAVPASLFASAPRFHNGGGRGSNGFLRPREYAAILMDGEKVLNPAETRAYNAGKAAAGKSPSQPVVNIPMTVEIHYSGQERPAVTRQRTRMDGERMVMELWMSGYENNTLGVRDRIAQG